MFGHARQYSKKTNRDKAKIGFWNCWSFKIGCFICFAHLEKESASSTIILFVCLAFMHRMGCTKQKGWYVLFLALAFWTCCFHLKFDLEHAFIFNLYFHPQMILKRVKMMFFDLLLLNGCTFSFPLKRRKTVI